MNRGIYPAVSGAIAVERRMDQVAHNLANTTTIGFKQTVPATESFGAVLATATNKEGAGALDGSSHREGVTPAAQAHPLAMAPVLDLSPGALKQTGLETDLAINGPGWFEIRTPEGPRYTRAGNFQWDSQHRLTTRSGDLVVGLQGKQEGTIVRQPGLPVSIGPTGHVEIQGVDMGKIKLVDFADPRDLTVAGHGLYMGRHPRPAIGSVVQGSLEQSNVNLAAGMQTMIQENRQYEAMQKVIHAWDDQAGIAIERVGQVA